MNVGFMLLSSGVNVGNVGFMLVLTRSGVTGVGTMSVGLVSNTIVSRGVGTCSPTLDTSGSLINIPDHPVVLGARAERAKCSVGEETVAIFALDRWPKFAGNWPSFPPPGQ